MKTVLLILLAAQSFAGVCINAGGPDTEDCGADQYFIGGTTWTVANQAGLTMPLRYGVSGAAFSYNIPVQPGAYEVVLTFMEPNKTAAGQRLFTVAINGQASDPLDVFKTANGAGVAITARYFALSATGYIRLDFRAVLGNAMVSRIELTASGGVRTITINPVLDGTTYRPQVHGEHAVRVSDSLYSIQFTPVGDSLAVYVDGLRKDWVSDYAFRAGEGQIQFNQPVADGANVMVDYYYDVQVTGPVPSGLPCSVVGALSLGVPCNP